MARYRSFRDLDWPLLIIALIICALGVLQIYSATHDTRWHNAWWKQVVWIFVGLGLMWVLTSSITIRCSARCRSCIASRWARCC